MEKHSYEITISTSESDVILEQPVPHEVPYTIYLSKDQIDTVIKWLREAKEELI